MSNIRASDGRSLDARVDFEDGAIVLHSRSGSGSTSRNPDYRETLETILARLANAGIKPDVFLDSNRVDHLPLAQRRIVRGAQLTGSVSEQFNQIVRAMNAGRASNGAWSKIRLMAPSGKGSDLTEIVNSPVGQQRRPLQKPRRRADERLTSEQQRQVRDAHINAAVMSLLAGEDAQRFADSRDYDLVTAAGERLAPKKVFGRALELAGVVEEANPYHFSAGWSQPSFELLQAAGYTILEKSQAAIEADRRRRRARLDAKEVEVAASTIGIDPEERSWIEGDQRMVMHLKIERRRSAKAAAAKRAAIRAANDGRLACERCDVDWYENYGLDVAEAIFDVHHTIPLKDMSESHETNIEDLLCLCANCHRAEHRRLALDGD